MIVLVTVWWRGTGNPKRGQQAKLRRCGSRIRGERSTDGIGKHHLLERFAVACTLLYVLLQQNVSSEVNSTQRITKELFYRTTRPSIAFTDFKFREFTRISSREEKDDDPRAT